MKCARRRQSYPEKSALTVPTYDLGGYYSIGVNTFVDQVFSVVIRPSCRATPSTAGCELRTSLLELKPLTDAKTITAESSTGLEMLQLAVQVGGIGIFELVAERAEVRCRTLFGEGDARNQIRFPM